MMETENANMDIANRPKQHVNILCSLCDISFVPSDTKTTICSNCILNQTDITIGITKEGIVNFCRFCRRYLRPPWTLCERESKELLSICLKRLRGLNKVKIIDAAFVYTDPCTKRIKVKLTIQKEIMANTNLQQTFVAEFAEHYQQCEDCKKEFTPHTWGSAVQVRQKVIHKKTFLYLEQLLLKNNVHDKVLKIEQVDDGLDFFYKTRGHAMKLVDYLQGVLPVTIRPSKQLISHDCSNNTYFYKYVFAIDLPKICKDDLVIIPAKLAKELGGLGRVQMCYKISTIIHLIDPLTLKTSELSLETYQLHESDIYLYSLRDHLSEFTVIDSERVKTQNLNDSYMSSTQNHFINRINKITVIRDSGDYVPVTVKSHLGDTLKPGSIAIGFDLTKLVIEEVEGMEKYPEIILVRRQIDKEQRKQRIFKLKRLEAQNKMDEEGGTKKKQKKVTNDDQQFDEFMDDVEKDKDLRKNINLYRNEDAIKKLTPAEIRAREKRLKQKSEKQPKQKQVEEEEEWVEDEDEIKLEDLMKDLNLEDKPELAEPVNDDHEINQFISRLENIKIEK